MSEKMIEESYAHKRYKERYLSDGGTIGIVPANSVWSQKLSFFQSHAFEMQHLSKRSALSSDGRLPLSAPCDPGSCRLTKQDKLSCSCSIQNISTFIGNISSVCPHD